MGWLNRLQQKKKELQDHILDNKIIIEQRRAEKLRKKQNKVRYFEPGTIRYGLAHQQSFNSFIDDVKERRIQKRNEKEKKD